MPPESVHVRGGSDSGAVFLRGPTTMPGGWDPHLSGERPLARFASEALLDPHGRNERLVSIYIMLKAPAIPRWGTERRSVAPARWLSAVRIRSVRPGARGVEPRVLLDLRPIATPSQAPRPTWGAKSTRAELRILVRNQHGTYRYENALVGALHRFRVVTDPV